MTAASVILFALALYATTTLIGYFIMSYFKLIISINPLTGERKHWKCDYFGLELVAVILWTAFYAVRVYA